ncbi:MAG: ketoacyl-ACP synthase III [Lentisphaeria bacterium]|nr:ketoacyl-ACP synthase III [Lentisphaeria bacterium]
MAYIEKIAVYLPEKILTNDELSAAFPDWSSNKIGRKTGILSRHIAGDHETALDLAEKAADKVLADYPREAIDFLLFCTQSPDYFLPSSSCVLQNRLGLSKNCGALDYNLGCSGYVYGLSLAKGLISSGAARRVLLITAETYSKHLNPLDRSSRTIFGDGAAATIISGEKELIGQFVFGTDGSGAGNLIIPNGGMRAPYDPDASVREYQSGSFVSDNDLYMNGPEIFNFTIDAVPAMFERVLLLNDTKLENIDLVVFHQANRFMLEHLRDKLNIPEEKFFMDLHDTGNTVSASIPIALEKAVQCGRIQPAAKLLLAGFGVGYSWAGTILQWS